MVGTFVFVENAFGFVEGEFGSAGHVFFSVHEGARFFCTQKTRRTRKFLGYGFFFRSPKYFSVNSVYKSHINLLNPSNIFRVARDNKGEKA